MRYLKITELDLSTGNILSAVDADTGRAVDVHNTAFRVQTGDHKTFPLLIPTSLRPFNASDQPEGRVIRIKTCDFSGQGHYLDIAGEGTTGEEVDNFVFFQLSLPEFWYVDVPTARKYGMPTWDIHS